MDEYRLGGIRNHRVHLPWHAHLSHIFENLFRCSSGRPGWLLNQEHHDQDVAIHQHLHHLYPTLQYKSHQILSLITAGEKDVGFYFIPVPFLHPASLLHYYLST